MLPAVVTLGADDTTPMTLASSYATLAAGASTAPNPILSITTNDKKPIKLPATTASRSSARTSPLAPGLLEGDREGRPPRPSSRAAARRRARPARPTTTSSPGSSATPRSSRRRCGSARRTLIHARDIRLAGEYYADVFGGTIAAPIWKTLMDNTSEILGKPCARSTSPGDARSSRATSSACRT